MEGDIGKLMMLNELKKKGLNFHQTVHDRNRRELLTFCDQFVLLWNNFLIKSGQQEVSG